MRSVFALLYSICYKTMILKQWIILGDYKLKMLFLKV